MVNIRSFQIPPCGVSWGFYLVRVLDIIIESRTDILSYSWGLVTFMFVSTCMWLSYIMIEPHRAREKTRGDVTLVCEVIMTILWLGMLAWVLAEGLVYCSKQSELSHAKPTILDGVYRTSVSHNASQPDYSSTGQIWDLQLVLQFCLWSQPVSYLFLHGL